MSKPRVTIADVAEKANVSKMTVSRVLNNKGEISKATRQRILTVMDELGYRPNRIARSLATNTTLRIGIAVPSLANPYFGAIIEGAETVFWENDYHILLGHSGDKANREAAVLEMFEDHLVDGVIALSAHSPIEEVNRYLCNHRAAVVINTFVAEGIAGRIYTDEIKSMTLAVNHLLNDGRRHIGYVSFGIDTYADHERYRGFELALNRAGLPFNTAAQFRARRDADMAMCDLIEDMLKMNPAIDSLVCFNTGIAARALQACHRLGRRVPDDLAIIGYDESLLAELTIPPLTTIELTIPREEVGAIAARMLLERIEDDHIEQQDIILEHRLVVRSSAP
jgi:DNA-binding LacI/PurR family transcriptional regulator